ncbi:MAG: agmatinase [Gracilibacteraceae bacterium]|jgi:agmatinase|nr:agmatinase [Gracilibacteraceae bacterium]
MGSWQHSVENYGCYLAADAGYDEAWAVLLGVPMDYTVSYRPGSRFGPQAIRAASVVLEEYSPALDRALEDCRICDLGDLVLPFGNVEKALAIVEQAAGRLFADGKLAGFLGGEHLVSLPLIRAAHTHYPDLVVLHFDAHADLREHYLGESLSHATVMRKVAGVVEPRRVYQLGIRSGTRGEWAFARAETRLLEGDIVAALAAVLPEIAGTPVYVSIDIDVVDPAFAPGTGTPEPGGCTSAELLRAVLMMKELNVVGFDVVEVCPATDQSERTAILAAKVVRELLCGSVARKDR